MACLRRPILNLVTVDRTPFDIVGAWGRKRLGLFAYGAKPQAPRVTSVSHLIATPWELGQGLRAISCRSRVALDYALQTGV